MSEAEHGGKRTEGHALYAAAFSSHRCRELGLYEDMPAPWPHPGPALLTRSAVVAQLLAT